MRIVRMVVKHLHFFVNSARPDTIASPYSSNIHSPWDEFKRCVCTVEYYDNGRHS